MIKQVEIVNRSGHVLRGVVNIPDTGDKFTTIINIHGFGGSKSGYKNIYTHTARFLAKNGYATVRFDMYGNGESDGEFNDMTFTSLLEDVEDIYNWTISQDWCDVEKIVISGQSMGGYVASSIAPKLNPYGLILMCPGAGMWYGCKERADAMEAKGIFTADVEGLCFSTRFNQDMYKYEPYSTAEGYKGPVLIVRGTNDQLVDDMSCIKYKNIYDERCIYKKIEGANHNFSSMSAREEIDKTVLSYLNSI